MQTDASEERLSKYEVLRPLGSGGMGEVYLARDTVLRRQVAIKVVSPSRVGDPDANVRLLREARAAATLDHPGICPVYDVAVDASGRTCIVMQYVEGETLAARLERGPLEPGEALAVAAAIADALAAAHARGIVHRDLKPQNIMLGEDGRPKLLDFGIAQVEVAADVVAEIATHTGTGDWSAGAIVGTPAYASPEQVLGKPVDGRSDLFALGAVLFECLTRQPAFRAPTDLDTWARVVYVDPPAPSSLNPRVPAAADAIVARLIAKDPDQRYASAREAAAALRGGDLLLPGGADVRRSGVLRAALMAAAGVTAVALVGYGAWRVLHPRPLPPPAAAQEYYERGLQYLRDGAYARAEKSLNAAVGIHAQFPQALARLAEARNELDADSSAQDAVMRIGDMTRAGMVLPDADRIRVDAISALLENDLSRAEAGYKTLAQRNPGDRGAWVDLARVRQVADMKVEARQAAQQALQISPNYAAAHLRLASLAADAVHRDEAIREFTEAARLYALDSVTEGQAETMLQQARFLDAIGDYTASQQVLADADKLLALAESPYQQVRALMLRSSLAASGGDVAQAERYARDAVATAGAAGLQSIAADAIIESAGIFQQKHDYERARDELRRGIDLANRSGAKRIALRGTLQLASVFLDLNQPVDARNLADGMLEFAHRYPRYEMIALAIIARSQEHTDSRAAEALMRRVLAMARSLHDDREAGWALDGLIATAAARGAVPEALDFRSELESLHRQLHDSNNLGADLTGRADLLIRLGRFADAEKPLGEIEAEAAAGKQPFVQRLRRVAFLRAVAASESRDFPLALTRAREVLAGTAGLKAPDTMHATAEALLANALASLGRRTEIRPWTPVPDAVISRDVRYWRATSLLAAGDFAGVDAEVAAAFADLVQAPSLEFEWRMAALGAAAAGRRGDAARASQMSARAQAALNGLRQAWQHDAAEYEGRADLAVLKRASAIS